MNCEAYDYGFNGSRMNVISVSRETNMQLTGILRTDYIKDIDA
jgi:hypothetical protein